MNDITAVVRMDPVTGCPLVTQPPHQLQWLKTFKRGAFCQEFTSAAAVELFNSIVLNDIASPVAPYCFFKDQVLLPATR